MLALQSTQPPSQTVTMVLSQLTLSSLPSLQAAARISCLKLGGGSWEVSAATVLCAQGTGPAPSPFPAGACGLASPSGLDGWPHLQAVV